MPIFPIQYKYHVRSYNDMSYFKSLRDYFYVNPDQLICFGSGNKDYFAALSLVRQPDGQVAIALPTDKNYFEPLRELRDKYKLSCDWLWQLLYYLHDRAGLKIDKAACDTVCALSYQFAPELGRLFREVFLHIYYGFVAENFYGTIWFSENPETGVLEYHRGGGSQFGSMIKLAALHDILYTDIPVDSIADWSRGKSARAILKACAALNVRPSHAITSLGIDFSDYKSKRMIFQEAERVMNMPSEPPPIWFWPVTNLYAVKPVLPCNSGS